MYQIRNWDATFENSRSREIKTCSYVCVPNKQHGMGFLHIITQPDGPAILGMWYLILEACSMQHAPRNGYMTDTGTAEGRQWNGSTLALRFRRTAKEFERALEVLCSEEVGWIENHERQHVGSTSAEQSHKLPSEGKGTEGKGTEGKEGKTAFGELGKVRLTAEEYAKLQAKHQPHRLAAAIEILDGYIGSKNKHYANHYAVLKDGSWVWDRVGQQPTAPAAKVSPAVIDYAAQYRQCLTHEDRSRLWSKAKDTLPAAEFAQFAVRAR